jgi:hypothetical protein
MATRTTPTKDSAAGLFIVDNSDSDWEVRSCGTEWCELSKAIEIATGYFKVGSLLALDDQWQAVHVFRLRMGDRSLCRLQTMNDAR